MSALFGSVEAGGTKFRCGVGRGPDRVLADVRIETGDPGPTLGAVIEFFDRAQQEHGPLAAIGVGSFGPVDLHPESDGYGRITATPKTAWKNADIRAPLIEAFGLPLGFDTDVAAAGLAEWRWGAGRGEPVLAYLTVGTGIGGALLLDGRPHHGLVHPEVGHQRVPHDRERDPFAGHCPYHGDCWEGLAAGAAMEARWSQPAEQLPADHRAWDFESEYLALGLANLTCLWSPTRIVLGGGVMHQPGLLDRVRGRLVELLAGYLVAPRLAPPPNEFLVPPALGDRAGLLGGFLLARWALEQPQRPHCDLGC